MMRLRRASMIIALSLLAWAATASAECAWVLWGEFTTWPGGQTPSRTSVERVAAVDTYERCLSILAVEAKPAKRPGVLESEVHGAYTHTKFKSGDVMGVQYSCWPDTVDPRGPKSRNEMMRTSASR